MAGSQTQLSKHTLIQRYKNVKKKKKKKKNNNDETLKNAETLK